MFIKLHETSFREKYSITYEEIYSERPAHKFC